MKTIKCNTFIIHLCIISKALFSEASFSGPVFITRQQKLVEFFNTQGIRLDCAAHGKPDPHIKWFTSLADGKFRNVTDIPAIRNVYKNGSLSLMAFSSKQYQHDIHATTYRCMASNIHGSIISSPVSVRAVTKRQEQQQAQVYDEYVIRGCTAVLRCYIPSFFKDDLQVTAWVREDNHVIQRGNTDDRSYSITASGNLHIRNSIASHEEMSYWCQVKNRITGKIFLSQTAGKIKLTQPQSSIPATIVDLSETIYIEKGKSVEISCAAQGYPPPSYKWIKPNGKSVHGADGVLKVTDTETCGSFPYRCVTSNSHGRDIESVTLVVIETLKVYISQISLNVRDIQLKCEASGYPIDKLLWMFNGKTLESSKTVEISDVIKIHNAGQMDRGMYQCFVNNKWETKQATHELQLGDFSPSFLKTFDGRILQPGPSIELQCSGIGQPTPTIRWITNGKYFVEGDRKNIKQTVSDDGIVTSTIVVRNIKVEDGGLYRCIISNKIGTILHYQNIRVYGLPIVHEMPDVTVAVGQYLYVDCYVSGYPIKSISWSRGQDRDMYMPVNSLQFPNGTLYLRDLGKSDDDVYFCKASNGQGQSSVKSIRISVLEKPRIHPLHIDVNLLIEDRPLTLMCNIAYGDGPVSVSWYHNDKTVNLGKGIDITTTKGYSVLQIHKLNAADNNGNYTCVAENDAGQSRQTVNIIISVPPRWTITPTDVKIAVTEVLRLHCSAEGHPQPKIRWMKMRGSKLVELKNDDNNHKYPNGTLQKFPLRKQDSGIYRCIASNNVPSDLVKQVNVNIGEPPVIKNLTKENYGKEVVLTCVISSEELAGIKWTKDDKIIPKESVLKIVNKDGVITSRVKILNTIKYSANEKIFCQATNDYGTSEESINLYDAVNSVTTAEISTSTKVSTNIETIATEFNVEFLNAKTTKDDSLQLEHHQVPKPNNEQGDTFVAPESNGDRTDLNIKRNNNGKRKNTTPRSNKERDTDNGMFDIKMAITFIAPAVIVFILLIAVILTSVIYLVKKRRNLSKHTESSDACQNRYGNNSLDNKLKCENEDFVNWTMDKRYGRLKGQRTSTTNGIKDYSTGVSVYSNEYEIPNYDVAMKPYATLQLSTRNGHPFRRNQEQNRDSQASI
ncbi:Uncharacterised protein g3437 [Pycnogonum litorale]